MAATRLFVIVARAARRAVVFRRGPSKQVRLLVWDLENDDFEAGQWFKGRIYERRCDLSPDGSKLIYFAANWKMPPWDPPELPSAATDEMSRIMNEATNLDELEELYARCRVERPELFVIPDIPSKPGSYGSWTAVSRPPYLTALALWPKGDAWGGGGLFEDERTILLNHWPKQAELAQGTLPRALRVRPLGDHSGRGEDWPIYDARLERDGWKKSGAESWRDGLPEEKIHWVIDPPITYVKCSPDGALHLMMKVRGVGKKDGPWYVMDHDLATANGDLALMLPETDWADWDHNGDLLFAEEGCLYRLRPGQEKDQARRLIDLRDQTFEGLPAPAWARRWKG